MWVTAAEAVARIAPGSRVYLGTGSATPPGLVAALAAAAPPGIEVLSFLTTGLVGPQPWRHRAFFVGSDVRELAAEGRLDYVPIALDEVPPLLARGALPVDVALLQVSEPDARGFVSLGVSVDLAPAVLRVARRAIAEVNPAMPRTHGESFVHVSRFDALVRATAPLAEYRHPVVGPAAAEVARHIAGLIADGATLQVGLGRLPQEALRHLTDRRDLGIHSDVITDAVLDLVEAGVVTGRRKARWQGRVACSFALGTARLHAALDDNPLFAFLPIERISDPVEIAAQSGMVSITQAFAVDLTGQVCTDQHGGQFYGGVSTQAGFIRGAARAPGGRPIICLTSTDEAGASRLRPMLEHGEGVGIPRSDVHAVVTEWGVAELHGRSVRERAEALAAIAHPRHRDALLDSARAQGLTTTARAPGFRPTLPPPHVRRLADGSDLTLRAAAPDDAAALHALLHGLTDAGRETRFLARLRDLPRAEAGRICDPTLAEGWAVLALDGGDPVGAAIALRDPATNLAETAVIVVPERQGSGI
uniref:acetyl-CoA hydrolase/transferase family protein n=1 Tax=Falsiroseomonas oryzae TaxID=2766473 RepID=UPI0022EB5271